MPNCICGPFSYGRIVENFAVIVTGSAIDCPANKVECVKMEYVPVRLIDAYNMVDVASLFLIG